MRKILNNFPAVLTSIMLLSFAMVSCKKQAADKLLASGNSESNTSISTQKATQSSSLKAVSLQVTVNSGYNISGDGKGVYKNGTDNVQAVIDNTGQFVFNTNTLRSPNAPVRKLSFDFSQVLVSNSTPPSTNTSKNYSLNTVSSAFINFVPLQNLGINGNSASECISLRAWGTTGITIDWRALLHAGFDDSDASPTSFAQVTRVDATHWTITALGNCSPTFTQNEAALRSGDAQTLYGYYNLPFSLTLSAQ